ncbi:MAG: DUF1553 domain-containing protein [Phycisphaerales bacterium]|nr:DUF1553 domain-containing protein [Phycisphaerales bacterium]
MGERIWVGAAAVLVGAAGVAAIGPWRGKGAPDVIEPVMLRAAAVKAEPKVNFARDIKPILSDRCFLCHGPDERVREETGGLRLDSFEGATADLGEGKRAIVPGDPAKSLVMQRMLEGNPAHRMPPPETKLAVSAEEIALIARWIEEGAKYSPHWSYVPPKKADLPEVADESWCRGPIDRFILATLESKGIAPSREADRETLIRRVSLDLTGLPPSPEAVDAFVQDERPDAYERVVDRLLASEHYGERMALAWLDVARYADTMGYHHDNERSQWPWRDWVIAAFNANMPYDRFIIEQIGGDLLPEATREQRIATGFCRNHPMTDEGGVIDEEYRVEYAADRVETMSTAFLAITMNCVRCHDHKYDPFTQKDYYSLFSFFNNINERGLYDLAQGDRDKAFPPFIKAPTREQQAQIVALEERVNATKQRMEGPIAGLDKAQRRWEEELRSGHAMTWAATSVVEASSSGGAVMTILDDGSVLVGGANPDRDRHTIVLRAASDRLNIIALEALPDASMYEGRLGRAPNGNAVLSGIEVEAVSMADPTRRKAVTLSYAWADLEQQNGDFDVMNVLRPGEALGWAVDGHNVPGPRVAMFLADEEFGFEGGTELRVTLLYESVYAQHTFGRVRLSAGHGEQLRAVLPVAQGAWFSAGDFRAESAATAFATAYGPESIGPLRLEQRFGEGSIGWSHRPELVEGGTHLFGATNAAVYYARSVFSPESRSIELSLGSDDAIRVFVNGIEVLSNNARRGVAPDQERVKFDLPPGESVIVAKVVNEGGPGGFYARRADEIPLAVAPIALMEPSHRLEAHETALRQGYRERISPEYRHMREELAAAEADLDRAMASVPNVMVMEEKGEVTPTWVLSRGLYDHPDKQKPVSRQTPALLGAWPSEAPRNRLGLGMWLTSEENPLTARVAVNRFWQMIFGIGIVKTAGDFGSQGEWPSHPELLDWLAVDFRQSGWDVKRMVRQIVTSATYRQSSRWREDVAEIDPENRLLARAPRYRLPAEFVRDNALSASGLLNDVIGGPSVRLYQPAGLWEERAMPASNTRFFKRDTGEVLYRRGMYSFWKRSAPPPQMATFDAPEREFCVARRGLTNTPLQALTLMNDEAFLEMARALAQRVFEEFPGQGEGALRARMERMFRLATGRRPDESQVRVLEASYRMALRQYRQRPEDAAALLSYGEAPRSETIDMEEHAAATIVANIVLNLDQTMTRD